MSQGRSLQPMLHGGGETSFRFKSRDRLAIVEPMLLKEIEDVLALGDVKR